MGEPTRRIKGLGEIALRVSVLDAMQRFYGEDLGRKSYLFADPFRLPRSFPPGAYKVYDTSFDPRPVEELVRECQWMRRRVQQIGEALRGGGGSLVAASQYRTLNQTIDSVDA
jgi:hypothetical protein